MSMLLLLNSPSDSIRTAIKQDRTKYINSNVSSKFAEHLLENQRIVCRHSRVFIQRYRFRQILQEVQEKTKMPFFEIVFQKTFTWMQHCSNENESYKILQASLLTIPMILQALQTNITYRQTLSNSEALTELNALNPHDFFQSLITSLSPN